MSPRPALVLSVAILAASAAEARDRKASTNAEPETCGSHTAYSGTTTTECRSPGHKPTTCESYTTYGGAIRTECR